MSSENLEICLDQVVEEEKLSAKSVGRKAWKSMVRAGELPQDPKCFRAEERIRLLFSSYLIIIWLLIKLESLKRHILCYKRMPPLAVVGQRVGEDL